MRVAVTSTGTTLESPVDERFGRAQYFLIVETDTLEMVEVVDNSARRQAAHGAGVQSVQAVTEHSVDWVLTGNVGPSAFSLLEAAGVRVGTGASGTVKETVEKFKSGGFEAAGGATSRRHMP